MQILERYESELRKVRDFADNSVLAYLRELAGLTSFLAGRNKDFLTATRQDFIDFKESLAHRAPNGISMALKAARSLYSFLEDEAILKDNPFPAKLTVKIKKQEPTDVPTAAQFLQVRERLNRPIVDPRAVPATVRRAVVETLAGSGLRIEALLTLKPRHLRLGTRPHILVEYQTMSCKGMNAGEIPITPHVAAILENYLAEQKPGWDDPLFNLSSSVVRKILKQVEPDGLHLKPHSLRHFYCSMTYYRNFDGGRSDAVWVRDAAGHGSISTTDNYLKMARRICRTDAEWEAWANGTAIATQEVKSA